MSTDIDAIAQRAEAATPGPWKATASYPFLVLQSDGDSLISMNLAADPIADAEFVAHARADVSALVAEIRMHRARLAAENTEVS